MDDLQQFVSAEMRTWKVPGLSFVVAKADEVLLCAALGQRDLERALPVTAETLFAIGSCTKAFATTALGILVDRGQLEWERPIREYMPDFRMHDTFATERMTALDLVTHRSGLPGHDLLWYGAARSRAELYAALRHLEPNKDLRSAWQYQNLMYAAAGCLVEAITGDTWEVFVRHEILDPLGMKSTQFSLSQLRPDADCAIGYAERNGEVVAVPYLNLDAIAPGGAMSSSAGDMSSWLLFQLGKGQWKGHQLLSDRTYAVG